MSILGFLDLGSLIFYLIILFLLLSRWKNSFSYVLKRILLILIILFIFHSFSNTLEWLSITDALDLFEDYVQILEPILWFFFFAIYIQEMTEKKGTESERKYRHLFETSPYFIGLIDIKGFLIDCNDVSNKILSIHTQEDIVGKNIIEIFSLNEKNKYLIPIFEKFIKNMFEGPGTNQEPFDFQLYRSIGGYLWLYIEGTLIEIEKQKLIQFIIQDISERKEAERELQLERDNLSNILNSMEDGVYIVDQNYDIEYLNPSLIKGFGPYDGRKCYNYFHDFNDICPWCKNQEVFQGKTVRWEWYSSKDQKTYDLIDSPFINPDGSLSKLEIFRDITERKEANDKLYKINRAYQMLSECNLLLVNAKSESELLEKLCKIVVEIGGYRLAWIGLADNNEQKTVSPVAQAGFENGYLESLSISWADTERGRGPTGTAIRTGKPYIAKNILIDPNFKPWRKQAIKQGYVSSIALPLIIEKVVFGSLNIYSVEMTAFGKEEDDLLVKLAENLSFGIEKLRSKIIRRQAQDKVVEIKDFYKNILENIVSGVWVSDKDDKMYYLNSSMEKISGLSAEQFISLNVFKDFPKDTIKFFGPYYLKAKDTLKPVYYEAIPVVTPAGRLSYQSGWLIPKIKESNFDGIICTVEDITERKQAEMELQFERDNFLNILNSMEDGVYIVDKNYDIEFINPSLIKEFGHIEGMKCFKYFEDRSEICQRCKNKEIFQGKTVKGEWFSFKNQKTYDVIDTPLKNPDGSISKLGIFRDISKIKKAELIIQEEIEKLRELDHLKDEFVIRTSHELKTPLVSICGSTEFLLNYINEDLSSNTIKHLEVINSGGKRLQQLVEYLLDILRFESNKFDLKVENQNLGNIIKKCIINLGYLAEEREITISSSLHHDVYLNVDEIKIEQVLFNLLSNALKNTPRKGRISISLEKTIDNINVKINDTGVGFTEEEKTKIFEKFGKIERYGKGMDIISEGSGLGLYLSRNIVELHGGKIWVESEGRNKGSTFIVSLPLDEK